MNDLFTHGHRNLFESQSTGLHAAWQRAAIEAARHPAAPAEEGVPAAERATSPRRRRQLAVAFAVAALAVALAGALSAPTDDVAQAASTPAAPVQWLAGAG